EERHDALARTESARVWPHLDDVAGALQAENLRGPGGRRVHALALQEGGTIDRSGADADAGLRRSERGRRGIAELEHGLVARLSHDDGTHMATSLSMARRGCQRYKVAR